ncbi:putative ABC transport system permease protein [Microbacterium marinum]|uniref:Putative ABC transport system permease protein n=1 Tax=Microbacterium marinum TaxID=421115 RepID=A0A7W7BRA0_9MICO|nr:FtsX-like permease family protein [Microbacterium marinum]MBB4667392.1 putative ABC transport system permease protein [Microbacterium marinum]
MSARWSTVALIRRHLRARAAGGAALALLTLVLSLLAGLAPVALIQLGDATVRDRVDGLSATVRDVTSTTVGIPQVASSKPDATAEEVWAGFLAAGEQVRSTAAEPLPSLLSPVRAVARVEDMPLSVDPRTRLISFAFSPGYEDEIDLVDGRLPARPSSGGWWEIALSESTATQMEWTVGDTRTTETVDGDVEIALVGIFVPKNPDGDFWVHAPSILEPNVFDDGNAPREVTATGFANPAALADLAGFDTVASRTDAWFPVDASGVDAQNAEAAVAALRRLTSAGQVFGQSADGPGVLGVRFEAAMTAEIEQALGQQRSTLGVIAMLVAGPVGVSIAVLVLACRIVLEARRPALRLLSARGASDAQLRGLLATEGIVWAVLPAAAAIAVTAAVGLVTAGPATPLVAFLPAAAVGLAPVGILAALAPAAAERAARTDLGTRGSRSRLLLEGTVIALAAISLALLAVRGYTDGVDLLLAAVPLLLALAACVLTLRLYPLPLRRLLARARRSSEVSGFLGAARALREPTIGATPVLALVVGVSVAVSSGILLSVLDAGGEEASRARVGSDVRITGPLFTAAQLDDLRAVAGVSGVAGISGAETARLEMDGVDIATAVFVIESDAVREVQGDGPGLLPPGVALDTPTTDAVPIIASGAVADAIGDADVVRVDTTPVEVVGVTRGPSPTGSRDNWVAIDAGVADEVLGEDPSDRTVLLRLDAGASPADVSDAVRGVVSPSARIESVAQVDAETRSGPAVQGVRTALTVATAVAALLASFAIAMTLVLGSGPRRRVVALLRTLGAPRRVARDLVVWEVGPPATAALVAGAVFGALIPLVVMAAVDLRPFTGSTVAPAYTADAGILLLCVGGFLASAAALTAIALAVSRRTPTGSALRTVEEG